MYAVIATGGKQLKVQEKDLVTIERLSGNAGDKISFTEVLAIGEGEGLKLGNPTVPSAKVEAEIVEQLRGPKLVAFKMKRRKGYRLKKGHRQELTKVRVLAITPA
jgi:large subunit ribosomal protein L21